MAKTTPPFQGFPRDHFEFFRELERNNNKPWFDQNRARYEAVTASFRALLALLAPWMLRLNPHFETGGRTNKNFSRINRDTRFRPDKRPYHTNYYLYFYDQRRDRRADGRLYAGASADGLTMGFSIYAAGKRGTLRSVFRPRAAQHLPSLERWLARHVAGRRLETYWYRSEKKEWVQTEGVPHTPEEWNRLEGWVVRRLIRPTHPALRAATLSHEIQLTLQNLFPLYAFAAIEGSGWEALFHESR